MKVYFDTCCINRPFDDQTQERVHLEAEAVLAVLSHIEKGTWNWAGSEVLLDEIEQNPDLQKSNRAKLLAEFAQENIQINDEHINRAKELKKIGFQLFDALHIACAESAKVDVFLSTDDHLLKLSKRFSKRLSIRVENPLVWAQEMI